MKVKAKLKELGAGILEGLSIKKRWAPLYALLAVGAVCSFFPSTQAGTIPSNNPKVIMAIQPSSSPTPKATPVATPVPVATSPESPQTDAVTEAPVTGTDESPAPTVAATPMPSPMTTLPAGSKLMSNGVIVVQPQ